MTNAATCYLKTLVGVRLEWHVRVGESSDQGDLSSWWSLDRDDPIDEVADLKGGFDDDVDDYYSLDNDYYDRESNFDTMLISEL